MSRLIDVDQLKKEWHMGDICETCSRDTRQCGNDYCFSRMDVCGMLDDAPTANGWISVNEKLPTSVANKVLVWLEHEDLNGYIGFGHYEKYKGQEIWYDLEHNEAFSIRGYAVTHWMPLPEAPKEDGNEYCP